MATLVFSTSPLETLSRIWGQRPLSGSRFSDRIVNKNCRPGICPQYLTQYTAFHSYVDGQWLCLPNTATIRPNNRRRTCIEPDISDYRGLWLVVGAAVVVWLSSWLAEQEDRGSIPGLATWIFRDWLSPASMSRYGWKIAKSTLILKTTNQLIGSPKHLTPNQAFQRPDLLGSDLSDYWLAETFSTFSIFLSLCISGQSVNKNYYLDLWLADTFWTSSLQTPNGFCRNLTRGKYSTSSTKCVEFSEIGYLLLPSRDMAEISLNRR